MPDPNARCECQVWGINEQDLHVMPLRLASQKLRVRPSFHTLLRVAELRDKLIETGFHVKLSYQNLEVNATGERPSTNIKDCVSNRRDSDKK